MIHSILLFWIKHLTLVKHLKDSMRTCMLLWYLEDFYYFTNVASELEDVMPSIFYATSTFEDCDYIATKKFLHFNV